MKNVQLKLTPLATAELCLLVLLIPITLLYIKGTWARRALKFNFAQALYDFDGEHLEGCLDKLSLAEKKGDPYYPYIHQMRGKISADVKENWGQAGEDYKFLENIYGSEALSSVGQGVMAVNRSRDQYGKPTQKGIKEARNLFKQATSQEPEFIDAKIYLACLEVTEKKERGLSDLTRLEKKAADPTNPPTVDALVALYHTSGLAYDAKGDFAKAAIYFKKAWQYRKLWPKSFAPVPYINYERCLAKLLLKEDLKKEVRNQIIDQTINYLNIEKKAYYLTLNGYYAKVPKLEFRLGTYSLYMALISALNDRANEYVDENKLSEASNDTTSIEHYLQEIRKKFGDLGLAHRFARITMGWTRLRYSVDGQTIGEVRRAIQDECRLLSNRDVFKTTDLEYYKILVNWGTVLGERHGTIKGMAEEQLKKAMEVYPLEQAAYQNLANLYRNQANRAWNSGNFQKHDEWLQKAGTFKGKLQGTEDKYVKEIKTYRKTDRGYYLKLQEEITKRLGPPK